MSEILNQQVYVKLDQPKPTDFNVHKACIGPGGTMLCTHVYFLKSPAESNQKFLAVSTTL